MRQTDFPPPDYYPEITRAVQDALPYGGAATVMNLARWTGFSYATVRGELFGLRLAGKVRRKPSPTPGRGPRWVWERCG